MKKFFTTLLMLTAMVSMNAQENVYILGNVGDQQWEPSIGTQMEYNAEEGVYVYQGHFNISSYFSFTTQLAETAGDWDAIRPFRFGAASNNYEITDDLLGEVIQCGELGESADNAFLFSKGGEYVIKLMLEDRLVTFERLSEDIEPDPVDEGDIYIIGTAAKGWVTNDGIKMEKGENGIFTANVFVSDSVAGFSFTHALAQSAANWAGISPFRFAAVAPEGDDTNAPIDVVLGEAMAVSADGVSEPSFNILAGSYLLTLDMNARTLTVTEAEFEDAMYIIGNIPFNNWDPANGVKMVKNGDVYTYEASIPGDVWFVFADAIGTWDIVNGGHRYGPLEANEDVIAGEDHVTQISSNGNASYKVGAGEYVITFDKANLTFRFDAKGATTTGDVNGDTKVDVEDVNAVINMILKVSETTAAGDVNNDGKVDVEDVNAIINIILKV